MGTLYGTARIYDTEMNMYMTKALSIKDCINLVYCMYELGQLLPCSRTVFYSRSRNFGSNNWAHSI